MKLLRHWKIILCMTAVFAAGAVSGAVWAHMTFKHFIQGLSWAGWGDHTMWVLKDRLKLTPEQEPKIRAIVGEMSRDVKTNFDGAIESSKKVFITTEKRIDAELTPEQCQRHSELKKEFREHIKNDLKIDLPME